MTTKTVPLSLEAYEKLRRARTRPNEPLSEVVMRAKWDDPTLPGGELFDLTQGNDLWFDARSHEQIDTMYFEAKVPTDVVEALVQAIAHMGK